MKQDIEYAVPLFKAGAEWRINSVWHKPSDIAEPGKDCLVEHMDIDGNVCICIDWRSEYEWVKACHYDKILRWAYIDDLLPQNKINNMESEKKKICPKCKHEDGSGRNNIQIQK